MAKKRHHRKHRKHRKHSNKDKQFEIIYKDCGTGRSIVSVVKRKSDGELFIWKRARSSTSIHPGSYQKELQKVKLWRKFGISSVKASWHPDKKSLLKTYIKGPTLKKILEKNPKIFSETENKYTKALIKFIDLLVDSGHYIHDLKGSNIVYDEKRWQVIDAGQAYKMSLSDTKKEYRKNLLEKWSRELRSRKDVDALKSFLERYI